MHTSVLLEEAIKYLNLKDDSIVIDCTLGYGGHSSEILKRIKNGFLYAFDQDEEAIRFADERLRKIGNNYKIISKNFAEIKNSAIFVYGFEREASPIVINLNLFSYEKGHDRLLQGRNGQD